MSNDKASSRRRTESSHINLRLPDDQLKWLESRVSEEQTLSYLVRKAIQAAMDKEERDAWMGSVSPSKRPEREEKRLKVLRERADAEHGIILDCAKSWISVQELLMDGEPQEGKTVWLRCVQRENETSWEFHRLADSLKKES